MNVRPDDLHALVGGYATHTLGPEEQQAFEAHLDGCESCRREVAEFAETLAQLSALDVTPPPPALRADVLDRIRSVRPLPPESDSARPRRAREESAAEIVPTPDATAEPSDGARVVSLASRRRAGRIGWLVAVAAALTVVALGGGVVTLQQQNGGLQAARDRVVAEAERQDTELATLMSADDLRSYPVATSAGERGTYLVSQAQDRGVFIAASLSEPGPGRTYQLWAIGTDGPESLAVVDHGGRMKVWFTGVRDAGALAFSIEPMGGSETPSTEPFNVASL